MTAQFWWGLAMLPLGALALAATIGIPLYVLAHLGDKRRDLIHTWVERNDRGRWNHYKTASVVALSKWSRTILLPLNYRVIILRDAKGSNFNSDAYAPYVDAIRDSLRQQDDKEAK